MGEFRNLNELIAQFANPTTIAINYVTDKIIEELQMQMADMKIGLNSNSFYTPTGEFYDAWKQGMVTNLSGVFSSDVHYDPSSMSLDADNFTHGSNYWGGGDDAREILPWIIFGGNAGDLFGEGFWRDRRDAWGNAIKRVNRSFNKWLAEGFKMAGVTLTNDSVLRYLIVDMD